MISETLNDYQVKLIVEALNSISFAVHMVVLQLALIMVVIALNGRKKK